MSCARQILDYQNDRLMEKQVLPAGSLHMVQPIRALAWTLLLEVCTGLDHGTVVVFLETSAHGRQHSASLVRIVTRFSAILYQYIKEWFDGFA